MVKKGEAFHKNNPLDRLAGANVSKSTSDTPKKEPPAAVEPQKVEAEAEPEPKQEKPKIMQKRKVGRPKTKDIKNTCKNINVAVPITLLGKWEDIKIVHGSNLTEYITKLIEKDMNANYEHYKDIAESLKNI